MQLSLSFDESWALFRLTIPSSDLWVAERESQFYTALLLEISQRRPYICRCLSISDNEFDEYLAEVADRIFPRFHVPPKALHSFSYSYSAMLFREARRREQRRQQFVVPFYQGSPDYHEERSSSNSALYAILHLMETIQWNKEEIDVLSSVLFNGASAGDARDEWESARRKFVHTTRGRIHVSDAKQRTVETVLDLYLRGINQEQIAGQLRLSVGKVNRYIRIATRFVAERIDKGCDERVASVHQFVKTWHASCSTKSVQELPSPQPDDYGSRWRLFHHQLLHELGTDSPSATMVRSAPYFSLSSLTNQASGGYVGPPDNVKTTLRLICNAANKILPQL